MNAKPSPAVIPLRYVASVDAVREYYLDQLGFDHMMGMVGKDGQLDFAIVVRAGGPMEIFVEVEDVDGYHAELAGKGVKIANAPETQWWGDRNFSIVDPAGHTIWFWKTVGPGWNPMET